MNDSIAVGQVVTPVGVLYLAGCEEGLTHVQMEGSTKLPRCTLGRTGHAAREHVEEARRALQEYFRGERQDFEDLVLAPRGTPFQRAVWEALCRIPYAETATYGEIARAVGRAGAARAVGMANHHNPIAIIVPCHRVIGANGRLVGYGGGLHRKDWLLAHESRHRHAAPAA